MSDYRATSSIADSQIGNLDLKLYRDRPFVLAWIVMLGFGSAAYELYEITGLRFIDAAMPVGCTLVIALIALGYGISGRSAVLSNMAQWSVLWVVFSLSAEIISYAVVALGGTTYDAAFVAQDARFGFSWPDWYAFVSAHPALRFGLAIVYTTLMPQMVFSILYFGLTGRDDRNRELFFAALVAFIVTIAISARFPALGALPYFGHPDEARHFYFDDFQALRAHRDQPYSLMALKGLITLPSFHTVLAILFTYVHRDHGLRPWVIATVNTAMLVSIPVGGGHYLSDILAGAVVAGLAILAVRWLEACCAVAPINGAKGTATAGADLQPS